MKFNQFIDKLTDDDLITEYVSACAMTATMKPSLKDVHLRNILGDEMYARGYSTFYC